MILQVILIYLRATAAKIKNGVLLVVLSLLYTVVAAILQVLGKLIVGEPVLLKKPCQLQSQELLHCALRFKLIQWVVWWCCIIWKPKTKRITEV